MGKLSHCDVSKREREGEVWMDFNVASVKPFVNLETKLVDRILCLLERICLNIPYSLMGTACGKHGLSPNMRTNFKGQHIVSYPQSVILPVVGCLLGTLHFCYIIIVWREWNYMWNEKWDSKQNQAGAASEILFLQIFKF